MSIIRWRCGGFCCVRAFLLVFIYLYVHSMLNIFLFDAVPVKSSIVKKVIGFFIAPTKEFRMKSSF